MSDCRQVVVDNCVGSVVERAILIHPSLFCERNKQCAEQGIYVYVKVLVLSVWFITYIRLYNVEDRAAMPIKITKVLLFLFLYFFSEGNL